MMIRAGFFMIPLALFLGLASQALSETRYVSDQLVISVREGVSLDSPRVATLQTDAAVELLEEGDRFLKIRTPEGVEGYVQKQYLSAERPKKEVIAELRREVAALKERQKTFESEKKASTGEEKTLRAALSQSEKALEELRKDLERMTAEYQSLKETSGSVLDVVAERDRLAGENVEIQQEAESLREENATLLRTGMIKWFLAGASVFLVGWVAGKISRKKRRF